MEKTTIHGGPKDFFLHLFATVSLFVSIIAFITLVFQYINFAFPDQLQYYFLSISGAIRWSTAALIVIFPLFLIASGLIRKDIKKNPEKREMRIRKWLIYFTLFVAAITIAIDLVTILYNYLGGELETQFLLKTLTVLVVAFITFGYYIWDIRQKTKTSNVPRIAAIGTGALIIVAIIAGFFIVGSPSHQRDQRFDEQRVNDLNMLRNQIRSYVAEEKKLPANLKALEQKYIGFTLPTDPKTKISYEYTILTTANYELCAVFETATRKLGFERKDYYMLDRQHGRGRVCFGTTIEPELFSKDMRYPIGYPP